MNIVPSPPSSRPNSSVPNAAGGVLQNGFNVHESKEGFEDIPSTAQDTSVNVTLPRADYGPEGQSDGPDSIPTHPSTPSSRPKKSRGTSKSEAIKMIRRGVKDLL